MNNNVVLKAVGLQKSYKEGGRLLHVLKDVNLEVHEGDRALCRRFCFGFMRSGG